ncbi:hypothetical protein [Desulforegula conservatrix]|uniref:hypothetical protein n=1 Tax=Desulforegula conservatrix TaxID=153026 RepID=UPI000486250B|nr:hypothetical protein [Desulforegula conservatrix]
MGENSGRPRGVKNTYPYRRKAKRDSIFERAWRSMRIIRIDFSNPVLLMTSSIEPTGNSDEDILRKWLTILVVHGYIRKTGNTSKRRQVGEYQTYTLIKDQVERPIYCETCGQSIFSKVCDPTLLKKETKKKRKKETEKEKQEICGCEDVSQAPGDKADEKVEVNHE